MKNFFVLFLQKYVGKFSFSRILCENTQLSEIDESDLEWFRSPIRSVNHYRNPFFIQVRCLMPTIRVKENEPFETALRRFKRTIEKSGLLTELRAREFYEKPTAERKRKKAAAIKRHYKRLRSQMLPKKLY